MDVIRLHVDAVRGFADWHRRGSHEQVHQGARMRRVQMLHDDERHTSRRRQMFEELGERLEAARGGTDSDNGKGRTWWPDLNVVRGDERRDAVGRGSGVRRVVRSLGRARRRLAFARFFSLVMSRESRTELISSGVTGAFGVG